MSRFARIVRLRTLPVFLPLVALFPPPSLRSVVCSSAFVHCVLLVVSLLTRAELVRGVQGRALPAECNSGGGAERKRDGSAGRVHPDHSDKTGLADGDTWLLRIRGSEKAVGAEEAAAGRWRMGC